MHVHRLFHLPLRNPRPWGSWGAAGTGTAVLGFLSLEGCQVLRDHRPWRFMREWEALYCSFSYIASINIFFLVWVFAVFRFSLWMQLMLYLDVKGITTILVKILATWGDFLWLFLPWSTSSGWREVYLFFFLDALMCICWEWLWSTKESIPSNI